jgi:uncharacterized membrane protein YoaK (UPF0700 family)
MKIERLFDVNVLTGVVVGALIGLHIPMEAHRLPLLVIAAVMCYTVVTAKGKR